jgi:hypothetical protein
MTGARHRKAYPEVMSTLKHPVGPQPSSTYWRRRLVVGIALLAVIIAIILIVVRLGSGGAPAADTEPAATNTPAADETTEPAATDDTACAEGVVTVVPITDQDSYAAGAQPLLSLSITNTGTTACSFSAGSDVQEYIISSGEERIWSSKDCQSAPVADVRTLEPAATLTTTPFAWGLTRSEPENPAICEPGQPTVITGGATYRLGVSVNGVESADDKSFILN